MLRVSIFQFPVSSFRFTLQTSLEPTCLVKQNLALFPAGSVKFYKFAPKFPTGRKAGRKACFRIAGQEDKIPRCGRHARRGEAGFRKCQLPLNGMVVDFRT